MLNLMGIEEGREVYLSIHDEGGIRVLDHDELAQFLENCELMADVYASGNAVIVSADGKQMFRMNASAANTQGMSAPCFRVFYGTGAEALMREARSHPSRS
jgi:hypothetical protein